MGFPLEACRRAVYYTGNTGIDAATNWIMSHIDDPGETGKTVSWNVKNMSTIQPTCSLFASLSGADFAAPLVLPGCSSGAGTTPTESVSEEHLETIVSMGFTRDQATKALRATVGSKEIFGIAENLDLKVGFNLRVSVRVMSCNGQWTGSSPTWTIWSAWTFLKAVAQPRRAKAPESLRQDPV